uniref:Secreted protein n=1 Tax=Panagrellus redivivus TaxID=6233 RepID=A0A7E4UT75_PANRE
MKLFFVVFNLLVLMAPVFGAFRSSNKAFTFAHSLPDVTVPRVLPAKSRSWIIGRSPVRFVGPSQRTNFLGLRWINEKDLE